MTNSLILHEGNDNQFAVLASSDSMEMLNMALDMGLKDHKIPLVKIPGGGATIWTVPLLTGEELNSKELDVVIVWASSGMRTYFEAEYGKGEEGAQPDCSSEANGMGYGSMSPTGPKEIRDCANCPKNQFKSAANGKGKACNEYVFLYCITPEEMLPIRVRVSPASLEAYKDYAFGLISKGQPLSNVITRLTLEKVKAKADYARVKFQLVENLSPEQSASAKAVGDTLKKKTERRTAEQLKAWADSDDSGGDNKPVEPENVSEAGEDPF